MTALDRLMRPASIAIVGASPKPCIGLNILRSLQRIGYGGGIMLVNPRYPEIAGLACYPSIQDLPQPPDVVSLCVSGSRTEPLIQLIADKGTKAAIIYDAGFAEHSHEGARTQATIVSQCREAGIALLGPNCMGVLSPANRSSTWIQELQDPTHLSGTVGIISQSGAICISLLLDVRRYGYSHMVSTGNEAGVTLCDCLEYMIADASTRSIGLFVEAIREPDRFVALLEQAHAANKPVIVLKVGRTARTKQAILSHTGGMTGESRIFSEVLRAYRAIEVKDLVEFTETLAACHTPRPISRSRMGIVTSSGGLAELILDIGDSQGNELPALSEADRATLLQHLGAITGDGNPIDAWGNGDFLNNLDAAFNLLDKSADHDVIALCRDAFDDKPFDDPARERSFASRLIASAMKSEKPHFLLHTRPGLMDSEIIRMCRKAGVGILGGLAQGMNAIDRLAWQRGGLSSKRPSRPLEGDGLGSLLAEARRTTINEHDAKKLLSVHGVAIPAETVVDTLAGAQAAAEQTGYPVVLKVVSDDIAHKSEHGLVAVGLIDPAALSAAWHGMNRTLSRHFPSVTARFIVQQQVPQGIEMFAGVKRDADFGLAFAIGFGGIFVEVSKDFAVRPLPLRENDVEAMLSELRGAAILQGVRGRKPADLEALKKNLYAIADYAWADSDHLAEIDVNPIIVLEHGRGCFAVDALIIPRHSKDAS